MDQVTEKELAELLELLCDERLSAEQSNRMCAILEQCPEGCEQYADYLWLHSALLRQQSEASPCVLPAYLLDQGKATAETARSEQPSPTSPILGFLGGVVSFVSRPRILSVLAGAVACGLAVMLNVALDSNNGPSNLAKRPPDQIASDLQHMAVLSFVSANCKWGDMMWAIHGDTQLSSGQRVSLDEGVVEITFGDFARVILTGPAEFEPRSPHSGFLHSGHMTVRMSIAGDQFTVHTPSARIVDVGTEFGVFVDALHRTEVYVFEGEVDVMAVAPPEVASQEFLPSRLTVGQSARILPDASIVLDASVDLASFIRRVDYGKPSDPLTAKVPSPGVPVVDDLVLWLAADGLLEKGVDDRVVMWGDLIQGDNRMREDARQTDPGKRPSWIQEGIGHRPSLRFDGKSSSLVTGPITTSTEQAVFVVFSMPTPRGGGYNMLLNCYGPPVLGLGVDKEGSLEGWVHPRIYPEQVSLNGHIRGRPLKPAAPYVGAYVYSLANNRAELFLNGVSQGRVGVAEYAAMTARRHIGCHPAGDHFFQGDIAEILIYNSSMPAESFKEITRYLMNKYSVTGEKADNLD